MPTSCSPEELAPTRSFDKENKATQLPCKKGLTTLTPPFLATDETTAAPAPSLLSLRVEAPIPIEGQSQTTQAPIQIQDGAFATSFYQIPVVSSFSPPRGGEGLWTKPITNHSDRKDNDSQFGALRLSTPFTSPSRPSSILSGGDDGPAFDPPSPPQYRFGKWTPPSKVEQVPRTFSLSQISTSPVRPLPLFISTQFVQNVNDARAASSNHSNASCELNNSADTSADSISLDDHDSWAPWALVSLSSPQPLSLQPPLTPFVSHNNEVEAVTSFLPPRSGNPMARTLWTESILLDEKEEKKQQHQQEKEPANLMDHSSKNSPVHHSDPPILLLNWATSPLYPSRSLLSNKNVHRPQPKRPRFLSP